MKKILCLITKYHDYGRELVQGIYAYRDRVRSIVTQDFFIEYLSYLNIEDMFTQLEKERPDGIITSGIKRHLVSGQAVFDQSEYLDGLMVMNIPLVATGEIDVSCFPPLPPRRY